MAVDPKIAALLGGSTPSGAGTPKGKSEKRKHKGLLHILDYLDVPGSYVRSAVKEGVDAVSGVDDASWKEFLRQAADHQGVGDYLDEYGVKNRAVRLVGGLAGDIALDPLTYLAPEAQLAKLGRASEVARSVTELGRAAEAAGDVARAEKMFAAADDVLRAGKGTLRNHPDVLAELGEGLAKGGLHVNVPGTGKIAQLARLSKETKQVAVPFLDFEKTGAATESAVRALRGVQSSPAAQKALGVIGKENDVNNLIRGFGDVAPHNALEARDLERTGFGKGLGLGARQQAKFHELVQPFAKSPELRAALTHYLDSGEAGSLTGELLDRADQIAQFLRGHLDRANALSGEDFLKVLKREDGTDLPYFPHMSSDEIRDAGVLKRSAGANGDRIGPELYRSMRDTIANIEAGRRAAHPEDYIKLFEDDPINAISRYIDSTSRRAGELSVRNGLKKIGLAATSDVIDAAQAATERNVTALLKKMGVTGKAAKRLAKGSEDIERSVVDVVADIAQGLRGTAASEGDRAQLLQLLGIGRQAAGLEQGAHLTAKAKELANAGFDTLRDARDVRADRASAIEELLAPSLTPPPADVPRIATPAVPAEHIEAAVARTQDMASGLVEQIKSLARQRKVAVERAVAEGAPGRAKQLAAEFGAKIEDAQKTVQTYEKNIRQLRNIASSPAAAVLNANMGIDVMKPVTDLGHVENDIARLSAASEKLSAAGKQYVNNAHAVAQAARKAENESSRAALTLLAQAQTAGAAAEIAGRQALSVERAITRLRGRDVGGLLQQAVEQSLSAAAWKQIGTSDVHAPGELAEWLTKMSAFSDPKEVNKLIQFHDKFTRLWKAMAIFSPGFLFRNSFGAATNMWLDGVELSNVARFRTAYKAWLKNPEAVGADVDVVRSLVEHDIINGGQTGYELRKALNEDRKAFNILSPDWVGYQKLGDANQGVENFVRGAHGFDKIAKGGSIEDAIDTVFKYHFNYADVSRFETDVAKRIIPFWVYTRNNLPLQVELLLTKPTQMKRFIDIQRSIEALSPPEGVVPGYFGDINAVRLPFAIGGGVNYFAPDLPLLQASNQVDNITSPSQFLKDTLSSALPDIKVPAEVWAKKQFFKDIPLTGQYAEAPKAWLWLMPALQAAGKAKHTGGKWYLRDTDGYIVENTLPVLGRMRRLAPSEKKHQGKVLSTYLSFLFGLGLRTNTKTEQDNEKKRQAAKAAAVARDLRDTGGK